MAKINISEAMTAYVKMRNLIKENDRKNTEANADLLAGMEKILTFLSAKMAEDGVKQFSGGGYTAFTTKKDSVKLSDKTEFITYILKTIILAADGGAYADAWGDKNLQARVDKMFKDGSLDLATISANKTNCKTYSDSHKGLFPPGVDYSKTNVVQVRTSSTKK